MDNITRVLQHITQKKKKQRIPLDWLNSNWTRIGKSIKPHFEIDALSQKYIKYFSHERESFYPELADCPDKGMRVIGPKGLGKTLNFLIYQRICRTSGKDHFMHIEMKEIEHGYKLNGQKFIDRIINIPELAISDLGTEATNLKNYGSDVNLVDDVLSMRYIKFQQFGHITHITTNINTSIYHENYGDRHDDRAKELFINIHAEGESKRM